MRPTAKQAHIVSAVILGAAVLFLYWIDWKMYAVLALLGFFLGRWTMRLEAAELVSREVAELGFFLSRREVAGIKEEDLAAAHREWERQES